MRCIELKKMERAFIYGTLVVCFWAAMAQSEYVLYEDPSQLTELRIQDLMRRMTLEEKIGQMTQIERTVASIEVMRKYFIGSVLSNPGSVPYQEAPPETWVEMVNKFQFGARTTRLRIPMIYGIDAIHGHNSAYGATIFPHNIGLGATRDPKLVKKIAAATALEVRATGIPYAYAPCVAVCRDPRWGRCFETFGEDPKLVVSMTEAIPGLQGDIPANHPKGYPFVSGRNKVAGCAKHYVGDGGTYNGINEGNNVASLRELLNIHMPAYYDAISKGVATVMVSFSSWNGVKMHANRALITTFLKDILNFRGFVISDEKGLDKITSPPHANYTYSIETAINAGIDMVMVPFNYTEFIDGLSFLVKNNFIPMTRIDDAVERILRVKFVSGLFERPWADNSMAKYFGCKEHRELAREAVRKSLVLLKNEDSRWGPPILGKSMLPINRRFSRILVAGVHANNTGYQCGGWTVKWKGVAGNVIKNGTSILSAIRSKVGPEIPVAYAENPDVRYVKSHKFSHAIVVVGELPYSETQGDTKNLTIADPGPSIINNVCDNMRCVVVLISGRPVIIEPYLSKIDALVAAWLPGSEGRGVADVLFGDYGFTGKLPITWPKNVGQLPMNDGDEYYDPLFPYGFGLETSPGPRFQNHDDV